MNQFKVGDEVVRISSSHLGMKVGDTAVITKQFNKTTSYCLDKYDGTHMGSNLQLVTNTKFKVGDVIIHNDLKYRKRTVLKIVNDNYQLYSHNSDTDDLELAIEYIDRKYHLAEEPSAYKYKAGDIIVGNKKFLSGDQKIRKIVEVTEGYYSAIKEFCTNTALLSKDYLESNYELLTNDLGYSAVNKYPEEAQATKEPEAAMDKQVGGNHYNTMGLQPLEACYLRYGYTGFKAAIHTKVDKYFRTKTNEVEDLEKAKHCIEMLIEKAKLEATKK